VVPKKIINLFGINYAYNYNIANNSFAWIVINFKNDM
jgi:hypothetical protein